MKTFEPKPNSERLASLFACDENGMADLNGRYGSAIDTRKYSWSPKCGLNCGRG